MDKLGLIRKPVETELHDYVQLFDEALRHEDDLLGRALKYVGSRKGKMMRPILVLLVAKELSPIVGEASLRSAVTLELLHTASLVHDDVVDESDERRGQASVNAVFGNKVAVLVGDYLLSEALDQAARTGDLAIVRTIARLGATLSEGEVFQLSNIRERSATEEAYFRIIRSKTAALFAACARIAAISAGGSDDFTRLAARFGEIVGECFQIRDDIFDYYDDVSIGKPTGNDLREGKLTLPLLYALGEDGGSAMSEEVSRVKDGTATDGDIARLIDFAKRCGGIEYAESVMMRLREEGVALLDGFKNEEVRATLAAYLDFVIARSI